MRVILMILIKCYPKHTHWWECKVKEEKSHDEHFNESIEINTLNTNYEMSNHLMSNDALMLEGNFYDV